MEFLTQERFAIFRDTTFHSPLTMEGALSNFHRAYLLLPCANSKRNGDRAQQVAKLGPNKTECLAGCETEGAENCCATAQAASQEAHKEGVGTRRSLARMYLIRTELVGHKTVGGANDLGLVRKRGGF